MSRSLGSATAIFIGVAAFAGGIWAALNLPDFRTDDRDAIVIVAAPVADGNRELSQPKPPPASKPEADTMQPVPAEPAPVEQAPPPPYYPADDEDWYEVDDDWYEVDDDWYEPDDDWDEWDDDWDDDDWDDD